MTSPYWYFGVLALPNLICNLICNLAGLQVPDELTQHLMRKSGQDCKDPKL